MIKPSQLTPENAYVFAQIVEEAGLPAGVFNLVNGRGSVIGHELAANPKVGMVSLTGSVGAVILFFHSSNTAGFMKVRETGYIHPFSFFFCYSTYFHKAISF